MQSTRATSLPRYIGADLTDRYSVRCRDIDVCGLNPARDNRLEAAFWHWRWDRAPQTVDVRGIAGEIREARASMLDGPQALATRGCALRACERQSAAVGKTPDLRPSMNKPFAGFICSSLDLFAALKNEGIEISPSHLIGGVSEVYPGHIWTILSRSRALPRKTTEEGRLVRKRILEALGVCGLPSLPTHDQNDACVASLAAAAAGQVLGVRAESVGTPLSVDADGTLREGPMIIPQLADAAADRLRHVLHDISVLEPASPRDLGPSDVPSGISADHLLMFFIAKALEGAPRLCTYAWAHRVLFNSSCRKFSQAYSRQVIDLARCTRPRELPGLGFVRLDAFVVSKSDGLPGDGYWSTAAHDREDWERALGSATILD